MNDGDAPRGAMGPGRLELDKPALDDKLPGALSAEVAEVAEADADPDVDVMVFAGNGPAFCAGYDLTYCAEQQGSNEITPEMP